MPSLNFVTVICFEEIVPVGLIFLIEYMLGCKRTERKGPRETLF